MLTIRSCTALTKHGDRCRQPPLRDRDLCFWHDPDHADAAAEARRLGGMRRKREGTIAGAYDLGGLESVPDIRRLLEIAVMDGLNLDNSVARGRLLIAAVIAAAKLLEVGEIEQRLDRLEAAKQPTPMHSRGRR